MASQHEQAVAKAQAKYQAKTISVEKEMFKWHRLEQTPHTKDVNGADVKMLDDNGNPVTFKFKSYMPEVHPVNLPVMVPRTSLRIWAELRRKVQRWESLGMVRNRKPSFYVDYAAWFDFPHHYLKHIVGIERNALGYLACVYGQVAAVPCKCCQLLMHIEDGNLPLADCVKIEGEMGGKCAPCFVNGHDCDAYIDLEFGPAREIHSMDDTLYALAGIPDAE